MATRKLSGWVFSALLVIGALVAVLTATVDRGADAEGELVVAAVPATSIDATGDVVLDTVRETSNGDIELTGWRRGGGPVEILADGLVVATSVANRPRFDVAIAMGLADDRVGFQITVDPDPAPLLWCAVTPGAGPGAGSCSRSVVDIDLHRLVAFYGVPGTPALGTLGSGTARQARKRLEDQAKPYAAADRSVVLGFEIIATVAQSSPGPDGDFSHPIPVDDIWEYLAEIRRVEGHVILDFQPGQGDYLEQISALEEVLLQPDVHLALDPEWDMLAGQRPAEVVGHTTAAEINEIMGYVDDLVMTHRLPRKLVIVHQFQDQMIRDRPDLDPPDGVQLLMQMDGHGPPKLKTGNYSYLSDERFANGFKLFYKRDFPRLSPAAVLALEPEVDYVSYQ